MSHDVPLERVDIHVLVPRKSPVNRANHRANLSHIAERRYVSAIAQYLLCDQALRASETTVPCQPQPKDRERWPKCFTQNVWVYLFHAS
jgi:hypothetical protein